MEYLRNKKATLDYILEETYEAGIQLLGTEVKSLKNNRGSLQGAYVQLLGGELYLLGAHIPAWQEKNVGPTYDPYRVRKLLVNKKELYDFMKAGSTKGLTIVPVSLYGKGSLVKAQIAIAKGKKDFDKRASLKEKAVKRDVSRSLAD